MKVKDFLFPNELSITNTPLNKILLIGDCLVDYFAKNFREMNERLEIEYILMNKVSDLPIKSDVEILSYNFQYIKLSLRSILTDAFIRISDNERNSNPINWLKLGKNNIDLMLAAAMKYNLQCGLISIISNFIVPQGIGSPSLDLQGGGRHNLYHSRIK